MFKQFRERQRQASLQARNWYAPDIRMPDPAIFVGGCDRSGTTLFKSVLDRHPRLACGPETNIWGRPFRIGSLGSLWEVSKRDLKQRVKRAAHLPEFAVDFYQDYLLTPDKKLRWVDKTPNNVMVVPQLLSWFPEGRFIQMIRDGRDVCCSLRHHRKERIRGGKIVPMRTNNPIDQCAKKWLHETSLGLSSQGHPRYLQVRYEDFLDEPESVLRRVCDFLGEDYDPQMLDPTITTKSAKLIGSILNNSNADRPIERQAIQRWRRDLSPEERQTIEQIAGGLLRKLNYTNNGDWISEGRSDETKSA